MKKKVLFCITLATLLCTSLITVVSAEDKAWDKKLTQGSDIAYWIDSDCDYTVSIPNAVDMLIYPDGMWNPLMLSRTYDKSQSKMDFYQESVADGSTASTVLFRKNSSGSYYAMPISELDTYDWVYGEITLNDYYLKNEDPSDRELTILHEMLHVYGLKDLYDDSNQYSIMYFSTASTATGLTSDSNAVLNDKY